MKLISNIISWINEKKNNKENIDGSNWNKWWMPVVGFFALVWFVIRVIPKPSRYRYPCQRMAVPIAMGFLAWLSTTIGLSISIKSIINFVKKSRYWAAALVIIITLIGVGFYIDINGNNPVTARQDGPIGEAKGINPGRVVWNYNSEATSWDGKSNYWWDDNNIDQKIVKKMWESSLKKLTDKENTEEAWRSLFNHFNQKRGKNNISYQEDESIAIKLNLNTHKSYNDQDNEVDLSPQMVYVLVDSLIQDGKVPGENIYLYDASRPLANKIYDKIYNEYPEINFIDNNGGNGRKKVKMDKSSPVYYMGIDRKQPDYLPKCVVESEYLINLASLKKHSLAGMTVTAKNHFGSIYNEQYGRWTPSHLHSGINARSREMGSPNPLVSLMGHKDLGGKTLLYIVDGLYGGMNQQSVSPHRWSMEPFNGDWSSSIFISQDPVAIDSVAFDFLRSETDLLNYTENYLHEAAIPGGSSEKIYDPEKDGIYLKSLGVHEHWNNSQEKLYSGNTDSAKNGIELIKIK